MYCIRVFLLPSSDFGPHRVNGMKIIVWQTVFNCINKRSLQDHTTLKQKQVALFLCLHRLDCIRNSESLYIWKYHLNLLLTYIKLPQKLFSINSHKELRILLPQSPQEGLPLLTDC